jgi:hypothetical protein
MKSSPQPHALAPEFRCGQGSGNHGTVDIRFFEFSATVKICGPLFFGILSIFRNYPYHFDFTGKLIDSLELCLVYGHDDSPKQQFIY